ncbi:glycerol-3-phosphate cytidylyltransferase [Clostridium sp. chh4-2]|uniref:adenylyltransferase/cytidyltransferase family protein n=1 Tax=Clostridium sp. chh4-2 TaxID=2067550 RepID=UPI000CCDC6CC|nr:adenylyltransferase/cytidyltransferase family protein [Clostridium sp. chh4-2]PNV62598.1 glycerol-3-phosphate cytidylyltransferase [Clostridium sp. chh4-2]
MKDYDIGYIAGVFDLFHIGHLNLVRKAKEKCNYLIVGVLTDDLVLHFKGNPPYIPFEERLEIMGAIKFVDKAVPVTLDSIDKMAAWELYKFDCLFSGDDYVNNESWIIDKKRLNQVGSDIQFFPYTKSTSSTQIKKAMER